MIPKADQPTRALGIDVGATLTKLATRSADGRIDFRLFPSHAIERLAREVEPITPESVGLTGAGAPELGRLLGLDTTPIVEFDAWRMGVAELLRKQGESPPERDLVVSIGTGTSLLLLDGESVARVGGTSLGGGTLLGLCSLLCGTSDFDRIVDLAARGDRSRVDLLVSEIDPGGHLPLPRDLTASCLAKPGLSAEASDPADLAHGVFGMLGDSTLLLCGAIATITQPERFIFGGSTLRGNATLRASLARLGAMGKPVIFLEDGEFAGALGALLALD